MSHWLCVGGGCGVCLGDEKGFHIVGFNDNLRHNDIMDIDVMYSQSRPPFGTSKTCSILYTSWLTPLCFGSVQHLRLSAKEHRNG